MDHRNLTMLAFDKFVEEHTDVGKRVLDVGCGRMETKFELEKRGFIWLGMDKEPKDKEVVEGIMESLPWEPNNIDLVFSCHSFEHTEKPIQTLREFKRVCKPNGYIFISTPLPTRKLVLEMDEDHLFCLNAIQMERLLRYVGIEKVAIWEQLDAGVPGNTSESLITIGRKTAI